MTTVTPRVAEARARAIELRELNAFISMTDEDGAGPIVGVKDIIDVRGAVTTAGSTILPRRPAERDAEVVRRIRNHGAVVIGKTNMHEWAFGSTGINPHYGTSLNPHDRRRVSGGSSGGSAVAVATGICDWAIGTDTGGSIRIPASMCGVVGLKPTTGLVSTDGVWPLSRSLDTVGPLARDVTTVGRALEMLTGQKGFAPRRSGADLREIQLGMPKDWAVGLDAETRAVWEEIARDVLAVEFPPLEAMSRCCLTIMYAEAGAFHRQWLATQSEQYGPDIRERLESTFLITGPDLVDAWTDRTRLIQEVDEAMNAVDALILPTTGCVAPFADRPIDTAPFAKFTRPFNLTGHPAITVPTSGRGLPVGVQLVGRRGEDRRLLEIALLAEKEWGATEGDIARPPS